MLFDPPKEAQRPEPKKCTNAHREKQRKAKTVLCRERDTLAATIGDVLTDEDIHFVTAGSWAMHNLAAHIANQIGSCHLMGYTWSVTEPAVMRLVDLRNRGVFLDMSFIVDAAMPRWTAQAVSTLKANSVSVYCGPCHAKGFLLWNDIYKVAVTGSANFSNNPRIETGVISTNPEVFQFHRHWVEHTIKHKMELFTAQGELELQPPPQPARPDAKRIIILRGLPGAGKSTMAELFRITAGAVVCEDDQFFIKPDGSYEWSKDAMPLATAACRSKCEDAMIDNSPLIVVSNTTITNRHVAEYANLAAKYGYMMQSLIVENRHSGQNIHNVPQSLIDRFRSKFEVKL